MTCVIGVKSDDEVFIGADRAASGRNLIRKRSDSKVFKRSTSAGDLLIGFTTSFRIGQVLQYSLSIPQYRKSKDIMEYMVNEFIESVRSVLKESGVAVIENGVETGGLFLVGFRGNLFCVQPDYQISRVIDGYTAIGSADEVALGSLFSTLDLVPEDRIHVALRAAAEFNPYVSPPFDVDSVAI